MFLFFKLMINYKILLFLKYKYTFLNKITNRLSWHSKKKKISVVLKYTIFTKNVMLTLFSRIEYMCIHFFFINLLKSTVKKKKNIGRYQ